MNRLKEFSGRKSIEQVEEGSELAPKFDDNGLIPVVISDYSSNDILMHGYMNQESLKQTIDTGEAHYWSRSRQLLWKKGATSGMIHRVKEILIDDDQDAIWLKVEVEGLGASCHVGYKSCFYRKIINEKDSSIRLEFTEEEKVFDPDIVYPGSENPTKL
tara:strand:+ start:56 stop:532 length:477 start_codon:yes stop_codon:yes gene_type:complete